MAELPELPPVDRQGIVDRATALMGDAGWWHQDDRDTYAALAVLLVQRGLSEDEAFDVLEAALGAARNEYGE
jgi:endonuclease III-like uncharacterized protein